MMLPPFDELWFRLAVGFVVGLALGSFVTMLSYRLPRRLSIIKPSRSFCPKCKTPLKARDLVPVLSWHASDGKCRYCKVKMGKRYPLIELMTAMSCMAAFGFSGFRIELVAVLILIVIFLTALIIVIESNEV
jgi:leader peptidase (prepilin peptidase)/N-methyltransferase